MDTLKLVGTITGAVLALVAVIGLTAGTVEYVSTQVHEVKSVRENVAMLTAGQARLEHAVLAITGEVATMKGTIAGLQADVAGLQADVVELQADVAELQDNVAELQNNVAGLQADVAGLQAGQAKILEFLEAQAAAQAAKEKAD